MATNYNFSIVRNGLVLYLDAANSKSYPSSGTVWTDLSRSGNNGTLTNGPTFNSANGGSIEFDGTNDYCEILTNTTFDNALAGQFTFEMWTRPGNTGIQYGKLFGKGNFNNKINGIAADWNVAGPIYSIFFQYRNAVNTSIGITMGNITIFNWYHLVVTRNSSNLISTYINGIAGDTVTDSVNLGSNAYPIVLGTNGWNEPRGQRTASFKFYTKGLSASEVLQNYNATKKRFGL